MIAMVILVMTFTAVMLVVFGNQSILTDSATNAEALTKAQGMLEEEQALARKDFRLVNPTSTPDGIYQKAVTVVTQSDYFTKKITATITWTGDHLRPEYSSLSALVTNFENGVGGSTCDSVLSGNWASPQIQNGFPFSTTDFATLAGDAAGLYPVTDVDAYAGRLYATVNNTSANAKPTFFIFNIKTPANPTLWGSVDTSTTVSPGLNAVAVATSSSQNYAYVASAYDANFSTCPAAPYFTPTPANCAQLQIINITNPAAPVVAANFEIPTSTPPYVVGYGGSLNAIGKSIFYRDGYLYLGLSKTSSGPEFNVIDVHNPTTPHWVGSWPAPGTSSGNAVNAIYVQGHYAYLATPDNTNEVIVLDISNPGNPIKVASFDAPLGSGNGKSLDIVGDTLYLGRTSGGSEFYTVDITNPLAPVALGHVDLGSVSVTGTLVRDSLAFLLAGTQLVIKNITNPAAPVAAGSLGLPAGGTGAALDCEGNYLYAASNDAGGHGALSVISP
jgi:hypothetical protein